MTYSVFIELSNQFVKVGEISEFRFIYTSSYLHSDYAKPISVSLPLQEAPFSPQRTKNYFDGLLPEGFTRRTLAQWMHVSEEDYLSILAGLGQECLGAIRIGEEKETVLPKYQKLSLAQVQALASEGATESAKLVTDSHLSLTGASGKVGLYYDGANNEWYQPLGTAPSTHIIKQSHMRYNGMVVNELLCLNTAKKCGINVPDCFILNTGGTADENILFVIKRYDREIRANAKKIDGLPCPRRLHQEDFAQALGIASTQKYESDSGSYLKDMFTFLKYQSVNPLEDQLKLWDLTVFNYLIGNLDNHLKNTSLLYDPSLSALRLAPTYDVVSTTVYSGGNRRLSMHLGDATILDLVTKDSFRIAALEVGLGEKLAMKRLTAIIDQFEKALNQTTNELAAQGFSNAERLRDQILLTGGYSKITKE